MLNLNDKESLQTSVLIQRLYLLLAAIGVVFFAWLQELIEPGVRVAWKATLGVSFSCLLLLALSFSALSRYPRWNSLVFVHMQAFNLFTFWVVYYANFPWLMGLNAFVVFQLLYLGMAKPGEYATHTLLTIVFAAGLMLLPHKLEPLERIYAFSIVALIGIASYSSKIFRRRELEKVSRYQNAYLEKAGLLGSILESSPDAIFALDKNYVLLDSNQAFRELFWGLYQIEVNAGDNLAQAFIPRDKGVLYKQMYDRGLNGEQFVAPMDCTLSGEVRHYAFSVFPIRKGSEIVGVSVFARDETENRATLRQLAVSESRLNRALAGANAGIWDWNIENGEVYFSSLLYDMLGYAEGELPNHNEAWAALIHPDDYTPVMKILGDHIRGKTASGDADFRMLHKSGQWRWIQGRGMAFRTETGWAVRFAGTLKDITERRRAELILEGIMQTSANGIMALQALRNEQQQIVDFEWQMANETSLKYIGTTREELAGKRMLDVMSAYTQQLMPFIRQVVETGVPFETEYFSNPPGGPEKWFDLRVVKLDDGIVANFLEITARKQAEEALRNSETLLRTVIDNTPDWIFVKDTRHRYLLVNHSFAMSYNLPPEKIAGKTERDLGISEDLILGNAEAGQRGFWNDDDQVIRTGQTLVVPEEQTEVNGQRKVLSTIKVPLKDAEGKTWGLLGFVHDITRHKETELELQKLSLVASQTDSGVIICNYKGEIEWVNDAFVQTTGYTLEEVEGKIPAAIFHGPDTDPEAATTFAACLRQKESFNMTLLNYHKDSTPFWVSIHVTPVFGQNGELERFICIQNDVTVQKQAESSLLQAKQVAEDAARAKADFLSMMSHEIRTPMNAVIGMTGLLLDTPLNPEQKDYVETIRFSGDNLLTVINDILDFSKIEAGKLELEKQAFVIRKMAGDVVGLLAEQAARKGLGLELQVDPAVPVEVVGDATRMGQILLNLLNNALKFTDTGKVSVLITSKLLHEDQIQLEIAVRDTGIGIPEQELHRLFKSFSQIDASTTRKYGGTGLGLAITRQLAELMGGSIRVESTLGEGSVFTVSLPLQRFIRSTEERMPAHFSRPEQGEWLSFASLRVLLAEDHEINQKVALRMLERLHIRAELAVNGVEAVKMAEKNPYDVIFMDMQMPEKDGIEATREIRSKENGHRHTLIIAMTANAMSGDRERCLEAGMDDYISKPVKTEHIQEMLLRRFHAD